MKNFFQRWDFPLALLLIVLLVAGTSYAGVSSSPQATVSTGGMPTITSGACGATTNGTLAAGSNSNYGKVQIGAASTTTCTVNWTPALTSSPISCVIFPANAAAAAVGTTIAYVSSVGTTTFVITGTALAGANYYYHCR